MYMYLLLIPAIPVSLIKNYTHLSYVSMVGITCATLAFIMLVGYCSYYMTTSSYPPPYPVEYFNVNQVFINIGIAMFVFEGNGVILNLRTEAKDRKSYPSILTLAVGCLVIIYMTLACISYLAYR